MFRHSSRIPWGVPQSSFSRQVKKNVHVHWLGVYHHYNSYASNVQTDLCQQFLRGHAQIFSRQAFGKVVCIEIIEKSMPWPQFSRGRQRPSTTCRLQPKRIRLSKSNRLWYEFVIFKFGIISIQNQQTVNRNNQSSLLSVYDPQQSRKYGTKSSVWNQIIVLMSDLIGLYSRVRNLEWLQKDMIQNQFDV